MTYPTPEQLTSWADTLSRTNWTQLASRLGNAIERDRRGGSAIPDGYPNGGSGSGGVSELTAVEAAVHARTTARDEHHDRTVNAVGYLQQAVQSLCALVTHLDRIEAKTVHVDGREPGCSNHARFVDHQGHPLFAERYRGDLCERCYRFKLEYGVVPPGKLIDDHARGIRWTSGANGSIARALAEGQPCKR